FRVTPKAGARPLHVPLRFWTCGEWACLTHASAKTQRPLLQRALRGVNAGRKIATQPSAEEKTLESRRYLSSTPITIQRDLRSGAIKTDETKFGYRLKAIQADLDQKKVEWPENGLPAIADAITQALRATFNSFVNSKRETVEYYRAFTEQQVQRIIDALSEALESLGGVIYQEGPDEDTPLPFKGTDFADHLQILSIQENVSQFVEFLISRIRTLLSDSKINSVVGDTTGV